MTRQTVDFADALQRAKLDALKELAYGASHEINNPLANISARAQALLRDEHDPERRRTLAAIDAQALRAHEMISDLMLFARPPELVRTQVDLAELVTEVAERRQDDATQRQIDLSVHLPEAPLSADIDRQAFAVAIDALIRNALEAVGSGGHVAIRLETASPDSPIVVHVDDDGPGIPEAVRPHLFDPFYSGREAGRGLGFGLSKCWRIVTGHGGEVTLTCPEEGGVRATIVLPR